MEKTEQLYGIAKNSEEIRMVIDEIESAKTKHPVFATCIFSAGRGQYLVKSISGAKRHIQLMNDEDEAKGCQSVNGIIIEELYEAEEAALLGDFDSAIKEFAQVAATAIRAMEYCKAMKEGKEK